MLPTSSSRHSAATTIQVGSTRDVLFEVVLCVLACGHFRPEHVSRSFGPEERRPQRPPGVRGRTKSVSRALADSRENDTVSWRDEYLMLQEIEGAVPSGLWCVPSRRAVRLLFADRTYV